jgi:ribonuclease J
MIRIEGDLAEIVDDIPAGRLARDGNQLVSFDHTVLKERTKLSINGVVFVTLSFDENDALKDRPQLALIGLVENGDLIQQIKRSLEEGIEDMSPRDLGNDEMIKEKAAFIVRRQIANSIDKKPLVQTHIVRK